MSESLHLQNISPRAQAAPARPRRFVPTFFFGVAILGFYFAAALFAPFLAPYNPYKYSGDPLERPSAAHWLGTNDVGHDIFSELIYGTRVSLTIAALVALLSLTIGALIGMTAGYFGGAVDFGLMRFVDIFLVIPRLPLLIVLAVYLGASLPTLILIIALLTWPWTARTIRAQVLSLRQRGYIQAARAFGGGSSHIFARHLIPELAPILLAGFITDAGIAVVMEAGLAFLGLGDPLTKSWGLMMRQALDFRGIYLTDHWMWWLLPPGINITVLILGYTFLGLALEERINPRVKK